MKQQILPLERLLSGGDIRSIGRADQTAEELLSGQRTPDEFWRLIEETTAPEVRMRAADALEKASAEMPQLIARSGGRLLALLEADQPKEIRWHLLQMAPRVAWTDARQQRLLPAIERAMSDSSAIVQTFALQALADLARLSETFSRAYERRLEAASTSILPSLRSRARKLTKLATARKASASRGRSSGSNTR